MIFKWRERNGILSGKIIVDGLLAFMCINNPALLVLF